MSHWPVSKLSTLVEQISTSEVSRLRYEFTGFVCKSREEVIFSTNNLLVSSSQLYIMLGVESPHVPSGELRKDSLCQLLEQNRPVSRLPPKLFPLLVRAVFSGRHHPPSSHRSSLFHFPLVLSCLPSHLVSIPSITCCAFNPLFPLMSLLVIVYCKCMCTSVLVCVGLCYPLIFMIMFSCEFLCK